jgi:uncharacterized GH25 family protein
MKTKLTVISATAAAIITSAASMTFSHDMWIEVQGSPKKGNTIAMKMISDHSFPPQHNELIEDKDVSKTYIIDPDGKKFDVVSDKKGQYVSKKVLSKDGTYLIVSGKNWLYWTKTTEGYKPGKDKKQVKGAVHCIYSGKFVKSLVTLGKAGGKSFSKVIGQDLEIIPLSDPAAIPAGGIIPIKVMFRGKPVKADVQATYEGFSAKENEFAQTIKTSPKGECEIKLSNPGRWLIRLEYREPAKQTDLCDEVMYSASLTFMVE